MRVFPYPQLSPEWLLEHSKLVTASRISDVMAQGKGISRRKYLAELASSILTNTPRINSFSSAALDWGVEKEPEAKDRYAEIMGWPVDDISLIYHPTINGTGASPDGLTGFDGMVEVKCPDTHTFIQWVLDDRVPPEHLPQMFHEMACAERAWIDFVAFDPRLPYAKNIFIKRLHRDKERIVAQEDAVRKFLVELDELVARFR